MNLITNIVTGGWLKGYRTKVVAAVLFLNVLASYLLGDVGLIQAVQDNWMTIAVGTGLMAAADHNKP